MLEKEEAQRLCFFPNLFQVMLQCGILPRKI